MIYTKYQALFFFWKLKKQQQKTMWMLSAVLNGILCVDKQTYP